MKDIKTIIKEHKSKIICCAICIFLLPPIIVHVLFKWKTGVPFLEAEWTAADFLEYVGTVLSFAGTLALGLLALYSSVKANKLSERVTKIEQDRYKLEERPFVLVTGWKAYEESSLTIQCSPKKKYIQIGDFDSSGALCLSIQLTNTTNSWISVSYFSGKAPEGSSDPIVWRNSAVNQPNLKMALSPGESDEFVFYASKQELNRLTSQPVIIDLILENRFSRRYKESFKIIVTSLSFVKTFSTEEWFCHLAAQNYSIGKFEQDEQGNLEFVQEQL